MAYPLEKLNPKLKPNRQKLSIKKCQNDEDNIVSLEEHLKIKKYAEQEITKETFSGTGCFDEEKNDNSIFSEFELKEEFEEIDIKFESKKTFTLRGNFLFKKGEPLIPDIEEFEDYEDLDE